MLNLIFALYLFLEIISYIIIADVILSWLTLVWLNIRPVFIASILDPIYKKVKDTIPTTIWPLDLTPIVLILIVRILQSIIVAFFPWVLWLISLIR